MLLMFTSLRIHCHLLLPTAALSTVGIAKTNAPSRVAGLLALLFCLFTLFPTDVTAELRITRVVADGQDKMLLNSADAEKREAHEPLNLASSTRNLIFHFSKAQGADEVTRLKYKLEGFDPEWRDLKSNFAVWLRLLDTTGEVVAGDTFFISGETPGWKGRAESAPMVPFSMTVTVTKPASGVRVRVLSSGVSQTVGQLVMTAVRMRIHWQNGLPPNTPASLWPPGNDGWLNLAVTNTRAWRRDGDRPELAQTLQRTAPPLEQVLFLNDDDPRKTGVWKANDLPVPLLNEGDQVTLEGQMAYSVGSGVDADVATYPQLKPGTYRFRVASFQIGGLATGEERFFPVVILPPLYQRIEFWFAILVVCCGALLLLTRLYLWMRMKRQLEKSEHRQMVEMERTRIARDIHDDLGATLAQIAMLSEIARTDSGSKPEENQRTFNDIFSLAYESTHKLNEIIWAINPSNDTLEHVVRYLCRFAEHHLKLAGLRFRLSAPENMPPYMLSSAQRHNLFLAAKEAIHNAVKYAEATEVTLRIRIEDEFLHLCVEDNGKGFAAEAEMPKGHGCTNMKQRMEQINGTCQLTSTLGQGTIIEFILPLRQGLD
jgi:hypothetical protein